jgi:putative ABC transport system permease protein
MNWTQFIAGISLALNTIREHKMRAFLTVLGVIIGTGTIIGVGSIITGLDGAITNVLRSFGSNNLIVFKFKIGPRVGNLSPEERQRKPLTYENAVALAERCPSVDGVSPYLFPWNVNSRGPQIMRIKYKGNDMYQIDLGGTEEGYAAGGQAEMKSGRFLTDFENRHRMPVVVLGEDVEKALFASEEATGKNVEVNGRASPLWV